jgi:hypothetical protein
MSLECRLIKQVDESTHCLMLGEVMSGYYQDQTMPLLYVMDNGSAPEMISTKCLWLANLTLDLSRAVWPEPESRFNPSVLRRLDGSQSAPIDARQLGVIAHAKPW